VKHFCNARNAIPYIQDIEIINAFCNRVSDIKIMEEIASRHPRPRLDSLSPVERGPQRRSRTIGRSTQLIGETIRTTEVTGFMVSSPLIRKRRGLSITLTTQRSGARFIVPQDTI
jgi:hypothetical protein